jgi:hypothetical protein
LLALACFGFSFAPAFSGLCLCSTFACSKIFMTLHVLFFTCAKGVQHSQAFACFHFHLHQRVSTYSDPCRFSISPAPKLLDIFRPLHGFHFRLRQSCSTFSDPCLSFHLRRSCSKFQAYLYSFSPASSMFNIFRPLHVFIFTCTKNVQHFQAFACFHFHQHKGAQHFQAFACFHLPALKVFYISIQFTFSFSSVSTMTLNRHTSVEVSLKTCTKSAPYLFLQRLHFYPHQKGAAHSSVIESFLFTCTFDIAI